MADENYTQAELDVASIRRQQKVRHSLKEKDIQTMERLIEGTVFYCDSNTDTNVARSEDWVDLRGFEIKFADFEFNVGVPDSMKAWWREEIEAMRQAHVEDDKQATEQVSEVSMISAKISEAC